MSVGDLLVPNEYHHSARAGVPTATDGAAATGSGVAVIIGAAIVVVVIVTTAAVVLCTSRAIISGSWT